MNVLKAGDLTLYVDSGIVTRDFTTVQLTKRESDLLKYFIENKNKLVTKEDILFNVLKYHYAPHTNIHAVHISRLRRVIDNCFVDKMIRTVRNKGYSLIEPTY